MNAKTISFHDQQTFPPILRQAVDIINPFVNDILAARPARYDIEYGGRWRANVAAVNHYEGGASRSEMGYGFCVNGLTMSLM